MEAVKRMSPLRSVALSRKNYAKLPQEPLNLSVLKLDGSCFHIQVRKAASVAELKETVEATFNEGPSQISWPHVWEQFCLCFDNQKLVAEIDKIRNFGIKDGDQLYFVRHHSPVYRMIKRPRKRVSPLKEKKRPSLRGSSYGDSNEYEKEDEDEDEDDDDMERQEHWFSDIKNEEITPHRSSKLKEFLRGWFSGSKRRVTNSRCTIVTETKSEIIVRPTRFRFRFWRRSGKTRVLTRQRPSGDGYMEKALVSTVNAPL